MNVVQGNNAIKASLRKDFRDGSSKITRHKCYGYTVNPNGELEINSDETKMVCRIFEWYLYSGTHEVIISDEMFKAAQKKGKNRAML